MLDKVRRAGKAKSILAILVFGLIVIVFIFMGVAPDTGNFAGTGTAATVNGKVISYYDLQERLRVNEAQMNRDMSQLPAAKRQEELVKMRRDALEQLVNSEVLYQSALQSGVYATPEAVSELIFNIGGFQEDGRFRRERYFSYLDQVRMTATQFESRVERDVVIQQVRNMFLAAWKNPKSVQTLNETLQDTKLNIEFVKLDRSQLKLEPTAEDVKKYAQSDDGTTKIQAQYSSNIDKYTSPLEVRARHILIKGADSKAESKIKDIQKQLAEKDFAELATEFSEDEGSKSKGGDLGFFGAGRMVEAFEKAAFSLPVGQVSAPVKSDFGYHLIKVEERRGGEKKPLDAIKEDIAREILADESQDKVIAEFSEALKEKKGVDSLLKKANLKWEETGEFPLSQFFVPKIEGGDEAINRVLKLQVGQVDSELLRTGATSYVLRLKSLSLPTKTQEPTGPDSMWGFSGGGLEALSSWLEESRKAASVQTNDFVLNQ